MTAAAGGNESLGGVGLAASSKQLTQIPQTTQLPRCVLPTVS